MSLALLALCVVGLAWLARHCWPSRDAELYALLAVVGAALLLSQLAGC